MNSISEIYFRCPAAFIIIGLLIISNIVLVLILRNYLRMFRKLIKAFSKNEKLSNYTLLNRILFLKNLYITGPTSEAVDLIHGYVKDHIHHFRVFIHVTNKQEIAEKIIEDGLRYSDNFFKSAEEISGSEVDLNYKLQLYKHYGKFVMILCVPRQIKHERKDNTSLVDKDYFVEKGICVYEPGCELCYRLPSNYVKGYVNIESLTVKDNPGFGKERTF
jgi:hypothetical protein